MMARTAITPGGGTGRRIRTSDHRIDREDSPLKTLRFPIHAWLVPLAIGLAMLASGNADAATLENLEGQGLDSLYGTYVPRGDCTRDRQRAVMGQSVSVRVDLGGRRHSKKKRKS